VGPGADGELVAEVKRAVGAVPGATLAARLKAAIGVDATEACRRCPCPLLYLRATGDRLIRAGAGEEVRRIHPAAVARTLNGPHLLLQRNPEQAAAAIADFFEGHSPPAPGATRRPGRAAAPQK